MNAILTHLKDSWRLASLPFILTMFGVGTLLLFHRRTMTAGRRWLVTLLVGYWVVSLPLGAITLSLPLTYAHDHRLESAAEAGGAQAVVVLGAGTVSYLADGIGLDDLQHSALRVEEGVRVYRLLGSPLLVVSGGNTQRLEPPRSEAQAYRQAALNLGVPADRIVVEDKSLTTREEAQQVKMLFAERRIERFVLVTSPLHMGRSLAIFRAAGLAPIPSASRLRSAQDDVLWTALPDRRALLISDAAIYEYVAWIYYRMRGWI